MRTKGNFGIGTFNELDGEMVLLDDIVYCLRPHGRAEIIQDDVKTPFAIATHFMGDTEDRFEQPIKAAEFEQAVLDLIPSRNLVYAIRIDGCFTHIRARSVPKQSNYLPLAEIANVQTVFEFTNVSGTIIGFYTPSFLDCVHVPGLHLHFITGDRSHGGHVLSVATTDVSVRLQHCASVELELPMTLDFLTMRRTRDLHAYLAKVER